MTKEEKQMKEYLEAERDAIFEEIKGTIPKPEHLNVNKTVRQGRTAWLWHCEKCGADGAEYDEGRYRPINCCSQCGNDNVNYFSYNAKVLTRVDTFSKTVGDYYIQAGYNAAYEYSGSDWYMKEPEIIAVPAYIAILKQGCDMQLFKNVGWRDNVSWKGVSSRSRDWKWYAENKINPPEGMSVCKPVSAKNAPSKAAVRADARRDYMPHKKLDRDIVCRAVPFVCYVYEDNGGSVTCRCRCNYCKNEFDVTTAASSSRIRVDVECPVCHREGEAVNNTDYYSLVKNIVLIEATDLPEKDLLIRRIRFSASLSNEGYQEEYHDSERIFVHQYGKDFNIYAYDINYGDGSHLERKNKNLMTLDMSDATFEIKDEILREIEKSSLVQSGLAEAWGLKEPAYAGAFEIGDLHYLYCWSEQPKYEILAKGNIPEILKCFSHGANALSWDKDTLHEILGISKHTLKAARSRSWDWNTTRLYDCLYNMDASISPDDVPRFRCVDPYGGDLKLLNINYGIQPKKALEYLDSVYMYQCIERSDALGTWRDYLNMATKCGFDLEDKSRKYPSSLKKAHDVATFTFNQLKDSHREEAFAVQAKLNKKLEYSFEDLMVIVPETTQDVVKEATQQKNCLRSYIERITDGLTRVVFIRRKVDPDMSYITVEVNNEGRLVQIKGQCNSNPRNKKVDEFLAKWCKARNLILT